jgi:hypothetical protein
MTYDGTDYASQNPPPNKEKVGYSKPPKKNRFKKGKSGNPKGRPRGSKNAITLAEDILGERVTVREGGAQKRITKKEAMIRRMTNMGMEGNFR